VRRYCWPLLWHWQGADCKQDSARCSLSTKISSGPIQQSAVLRTLYIFLLLQPNMRSAFRKNFRTLEKTCIVKKCCKIGREVKNVWLAALRRR
jgi:hypothetical protein